MTLIKICGITSLEDARAAVEAGADMLGFNFYRPSSRFIEPIAARTIIGSLRSEGVRPVKMVGVFVNEASPQAVMVIVNAADVSAVQLHGDEPVEFCQSLKQLLGAGLLIKVFRVSDNFSPVQVRNFPADAIMLDAFHGQLRGGTGEVFDWSIARSARELAPRLFLAGGLSPENVAEAVEQVNPYAVDACSSLESSLGRKDAGRMKAFVQAVRNG